MCEVTELEPGELVDLDSGVRVIRSSDGDEYMVKESRHHRTHNVVLPKESVEALAKLAGFDVPEVA